MANALPKTYEKFCEKFPELAEAHRGIAAKVDEAGPLDEKQRELIKIGISLGAGLESATKSHVRRALSAGATLSEVEQAILLGMNTCGFPRTAAALSWAWRRVEEDA